MISLKETTAGDGKKMEQHNPLNKAEFFSYRGKYVSPDEAVKAIRSGDVVHYGAFNGTVYDLDEALARRIHELHDVKVIASIWPYAHRPAIMRADPEARHVRWQSSQFSPVERQMNKDGMCWYIPVQYREQLKYWRQDTKIDVSMLQVTPMDRNGFFNLGPQVSDAMAVFERARVIIVEVNEKMPKVCGAYGNALHISGVDYVIQGGNRPLPERLSGKPTVIQKKIAEHIVPLIRNGSSLQLGIGGLPNSVGSLIANSDIKDLSVHSEMFVDAFLNLYKEGKITGKKKLDRGKMVWTFSMGSQELYEFIHENPIHLVYPVEYVNEISTVAKIDNFVSINSCLEVDLFGQVNSESSGLQHIGGNGGQLDFVLGAYLSKGGQSFLCTPSTFQTKDGQLRSLIRGRFDAGTIITIPRQATHNVVTEYGIACLKAKSTWQRAEALINIAHPDFRDGLVREAEKMGIWKNTSRRS